MRWVILTDDYPPAPGGIATWTRWAATTLATRHAVDVYCRARPGLVSGDGLAIHPVRARSFARRGPVALAWAARGALRDADGVLCTTWPVARVVRRWRPVHVVGHGGDLVRPRRPALLERVWPGCAHHWVVSEHLRSVAVSRGLDARVLPVPVVAEAPAGQGSRWVFVARALHGKGGDTFLRWVQEAGATGDVVGDGPALASWRRQAERHGLDVRFHGTRTRAEVATVLERARAVFLPSRRTLSEGLGLTLLEARSRGIRVVTTGHGGTREAAGRDGLVVPATTHGAVVRDRLATLPPPVWTDPRPAFLQALGA
jgi:glycosyltransferase involved in cell wall biosynthesis